MKFQVTAVAVACATLLAACGGGGGGGEQGGTRQTLSFEFPGGATVGIPPEVATTKLKAIASSGGPVTFASNTPDTCTVNGDTLSLLKAGECSVTATQAGHEGYAAVSKRQLFVIPKRPQTIVFFNPGSQLLDSNPVALVAATDTSRPVTFSTTTPSVCTVSGTTLTKVNNGMCIVTATQVGGDIFETPTLTRNIPIGTEKAAALTFLSGYTNNNTTKEGGAIGTYAGASIEGWWCGDSTRCFPTAAGDGNSWSYTYNIVPADPNASGIGAYYGFTINATSAGLSDTGPTANGVRIDSQGALNLSLGQNQEWFGTGNNSLNIDLILGMFQRKADNSACNVKLRAVLKPTAAAITSYSLRLQDRFTVSESCGLTGLEVWTLLQLSSIPRIEISAVNTNTSAKTVGASQVMYTTKVTLSGPITFQ